MTFLNWFSDNWFELLESLGIVGGLFFTGLALRTDSKVRRIDNLFTITKQHREIWNAVYARPDLKRVVDKSANLATQPVMEDEEMFVNQLILHLSSSYRAAKVGMFELSSGLGADIAAFFSLPIPRAVWEKTKAFREPEFVAFVDRCLAP